MKILIFTSKNHWYANALLAGLLSHGAFTNDQLIVWEQDVIVPGKSLAAGLWRYIRVSGATYVFWQAVKQLFFMFCRTKAMLLRDTKSPCYPYYRLTSMVRETVRGLQQPSFIAEVKKIQPDLLLSLFSKEIIPPAILDIPKYGAVNLHPAPLPDYRGVSPTFWAMTEGKKTHGVTLHTLDAGIDTGTIIMKKVFSIQTYTSEHRLYLRCVNEGMVCVSLFLRMIGNRKRMIPRYFVKQKGSYRSLPTKVAVKRFLERGMRFI